MSQEKPLRKSLFGEHVEKDSLINAIWNKFPQGLKDGDKIYTAKKLENSIATIQKLLLEGNALDSKEVLRFVNKLPVAEGFRESVYTILGGNIDALPTKISPPAKEELQPTQQDNSERKEPVTAAEPTPSEILSETPKETEPAKLSEKELIEEQFVIDLQKASNVSELTALAALYKQKASKHTPGSETRKNYNNKIQLISDKAREISKAAEQARVEIAKKEKAASSKIERPQVKPAPAKVEEQKEEPKAEIKETPIPPQAEKKVTLEEAEVINFGEDILTFNEVIKKLQSISSIPEGKKFYQSAEIITTINELLAFIDKQGESLITFNKAQKVEDVPKRGDLTSYQDYLKRIPKACGLRATVIRLTEKRLNKNSQEKPPQATGAEKAIKWIESQDFAKQLDENRESIEKLKGLLATYRIQAALIERESSQEAKAAQMMCDDRIAHIKAEIQILEVSQPQKNESAPAFSTSINFDELITQLESVPHFSLQGQVYETADIITAIKEIVFLVEGLAQQDNDSKKLTIKRYQELLGSIPLAFALHATVETLAEKIITENKKKPDEKPLKEKTATAESSFIYNEAITNFDDLSAQVMSEGDITENGTTFTVEQILDAVSLIKSLVEQSKEVRNNSLSELLKAIPPHNGLQKTAARLFREMLDAKESALRGKKSQALKHAAKNANDVGKASIEISELPIPEKTENTQFPEKAEQKEVIKEPQIIFRDGSIETDNEFFKICESYEDLIDLLGSVEEIIGSEGEVFSADEIKNTLTYAYELVQKNPGQPILKGVIDYFPRTGGLRKTILKILNGIILEAKSTQENPTVSKEEKLRDRATFEARLAQAFTKKELRDLEEDLERIFDSEDPELLARKDDIASIDRENTTKLLLQGYINRLGLKREELEANEAFMQCDVPQQIVTLQNLEQIVLEQVKEKGVAQFEEKMKQTGVGGFFKKVWFGAQKNFVIARNEKKAFEEATENALQSVGLERFTEIATEAKKLPVEITRSGLVQVNYAQEFSNLNQTELERIERFNAAANRFAQIPLEWRYPDTATTEQQKRYADAAALFELYSTQLVDLKTKELQLAHPEMSELDIAVATSQYLHKVKTNVELQQFVQTHPETREELSKIEHTSVFKKGLKDIYSEKKLPFLIGGGLRLAIGKSVTLGSVGTLSFLAAPLIAGGAVGGFLANRRVSEQLRREDILGRKSGLTKVEITSEISKIDGELAKIRANQVPTPEETIDIEALEKKKKELVSRLSQDDLERQEEKRSLALESQKAYGRYIELDRLSKNKQRKFTKEEKAELKAFKEKYHSIEEAREELRKIESKHTAKNLAPAAFLTDKLLYLIDRVNIEQNLIEKEKCVQSLRVRIEYTKDKIEEGLVSYGKGSIGIEKHVSLLNALGVAETSLLLEQGEGKKLLETLYSSITENEDVPFVPKSKIVNEKKGKTINDSEESYVTYLTNREQYIRDGFKDLLSDKADRIKSARLHYRMRQMAKGMAMGAGFGLAGYWVADRVHAWWNSTHPKVATGTEPAIKVSRKPPQITMKRVAPQQFHVPIGPDGEIRFPENAVADALRDAEKASKSVGKSSSIALPIRVEYPDVEVEAEIPTMPVVAETQSVPEEITPEAPVIPETTSPQMEEPVVTPDSETTENIIPLDSENESLLTAFPKETTKLQELGETALDQSVSYEAPAPEEIVTPTPAPEVPPEIAPTPAPIETPETPKIITRKIVDVKNAKGKTIYGSQEQVLKNYFIEDKGLSPKEAGNTATLLIKKFGHEGVKIVHAEDEMQIMENAKGEVIGIKMIPQSEIPLKAPEALESQVFKDTIENYKFRGKLVHDSVERSIFQLVNKNALKLGYTPDGVMTPSQWAREEVKTFFRNPDNHYLRTVITHDGNEIFGSRNPDGSLQIKLEQGTGRAPTFKETPPETEPIEPSSEERAVEAPKVEQVAPEQSSATRGVRLQVEEAKPETPKATEPEKASQKPIGAVDVEKEVPKLTPKQIKERERFLQSKIPKDKKGNFIFTKNQQRIFDEIAAEAMNQTPLPTKEDLDPAEIAYVPPESKLDYDEFVGEVEPTVEIVAGTQESNNLFTDKVIPSEGHFNMTAFKEMARINSKMARIYDGYERAITDVERDGFLWKEGMLTTAGGQNDVYVRPGEKMALTGESLKSDSATTKHFFAARWEFDYSSPEAFIKSVQKIKNSIGVLYCEKTGKYTYAYPKEWGTSPIAVVESKKIPGRYVFDLGKDGKTPNYWKRAFDVSKVVRDKLGANDKDMIQVRMIDKGNYEIDKNGNLVERSGSSAKKITRK